MIETIKNHKLGQVLDSWGFQSFFYNIPEKQVARVGMRCITCFVKHNSHGVLTTFELQMAQQKLDESTYSRYEKWSTWDAPQPNWTFTNGVWLMFPQAKKSWDLWLTTKVLGNSVVFFGPSYLMSTLSKSSKEHNCWSFGDSVRFASKLMPRAKNCRPSFHVHVWPLLLVLLHDVWPTPGSLLDSRLHPYRSHFQMSPTKNPWISTIYRHIGMKHMIKRPSNRKRFPAVEVSWRLFNFEISIPQ